MTGMTATSEALSLLQVIALALPATAILFQLIYSMIEESELSLFMERLLIGSMILTLFLFGAAGFLAVSVYGKNAANELLNIASIIIFWGFVSVILAAHIGYISIKYRLFDWVESEVGFDRLVNAQKERERVIEKIDALLGFLDEVEDSEGQMDELSEEHFNLLETVQDELDFDVSSIETYADADEVIRADLVSLKGELKEMADEESAIISDIEDIKVEVEQTLRMAPTGSEIRTLIRHPINTTISNPNVFFLIIFSLAFLSLFTINLFDHWARWMPLVIEIVLIPLYYYFGGH